LQDSNTQSNAIIIAISSAENMLRSFGNLTSNSVMKKAAEVKSAVLKRPYIPVNHFHDGGYDPL